MSLIRNSQQTKQGIDFTGLQNGLIHPTDIDAVLEFGNRVLILFEMKRKGNIIPRGQELALERIVDNWTTGERVAVAMKITHSFNDDSIDVPIEQCEVELCYTTDKKWVTPKTKDVKEFLNRLGKVYKEPKLKF